jgi:hypothetical protein
MTKAKDPADRVPYQNAGAVRQLLAERENAVIYGQATRVDAIDKQLAEFGVKVSEDPAPAPDEKPAAKKAPQGRTATPPAQQDAKRSD